MKINKNKFSEMAIARKNSLSKYSHELNDYLKEYASTNDICLQYNPIDSDEIVQFIGVKKVPEFLTKFSEWSTFLIEINRVGKIINKLGKSEIWECMSSDVENKLTKCLKNLLKAQEDLNTLFNDLIDEALEFNENNGFKFNDTRHCVSYKQPNPLTVAWCDIYNGQISRRDSFVTNKIDTVKLFPADNRFFREFVVYHLERELDDWFFFLMYSDNGIYLNIAKRLNYYHLNINANFNSEFELDDENTIKRELEEWATSVSQTNRVTTYRKLLFSHNNLNYYIDIEFHDSVKSICAYLREG